jgi:hypothetical protein
MRLLESTMRDDTPAPWVVPLSDGGVQMEWHERGLDIEIGVPPSDESIDVWSNDAHGRWAHEYEVNDEQSTGWLRGLLAELSRRP